MSSSDCRQTRKEERLPETHSGYLYHAASLDNFVMQNQRHNGYVVGEPESWLRLSSEVGNVVLEAEERFNSPHFVILGVVAQRLMTPPSPIESKGGIKCGGEYHVAFLNPDSYLPFSPIGGPPAYKRIYKRREQQRQTHGITPEWDEEFYLSEVREIFYDRLEELTFFESTQGIQSFREEFVKPIIRCYQEKNSA